MKSSKRCCARRSWDFVQINYALDDRARRARLLPLAAERGVGGDREPAVRRRRAAAQAFGRKLPAWAGEIGCTSWAQVLLKFVLATRPSPA